MDEKEILIKRIWWCDAMVVTSFVLMLAVKLITITLFAKIAVISGAEIDNIASTMEANPFFEMSIKLKQIGYVIGIIILPASAIAYYLFIRRKVIEGRSPIETLEFFVSFAFFALLINIVNDGASLLGMSMR